VIVGLQTVTSILTLILYTHYTTSNAICAGLLKFSDEIDIGFYLDQYDDKAKLIAAIRRLDIRGGDTNIAEALKRTRNEMFSTEHGARPGVAKVRDFVAHICPMKFCSNM